MRLATPHPTLCTLGGLVTSRDHPSEVTWPNTFKERSWSQPVCKNVFATFVREDGVSTVRSDGAWWRHGALAYARRRVLSANGRRSLSATSSLWTTATAARCSTKYTLSQCMCTRVVYALFWIESLIFHAVFLTCKLCYKYLTHCVVWCVHIIFVRHRCVCVN